MYINKVALCGRLGGNPELEEVNGKSVVNFSLATTATWKDKSGKKQERTEWHKCVAWERNADNIAEYVSKGDELYVEGDIRYDKWETKEGVKMTTAKIHVQSFQFGQKKRDGGDEGAGDRDNSRSRRARSDADDSGEEPPF